MVGAALSFMGDIMRHSAGSRFAPGRRAVLAGSLALGLARGARAADRPAIRLGIVQFGTVQWIADVIRRHALDAAHGFTLETVPLANTDAGRVAMMAGQADVVVLDWPFVAVQRAAGRKLCFAPFSSATGGIVARADGGIRTLADLKGRRLGVAGGPADKSWLVVQAAARKSAGIDLAGAAQLSYGAPPLLGAKLEQGELDAVLTFWNFAARLEADGYAEIVRVADCAVALGLPARLDLIGFVFREDWATGNAAAIDGFLAASAAAEQMLAQSPAEWDAIRPLMGSPDDRLFARLRERFNAGVAALPDPATQERDAARLFAVLKESGGAATDGFDALPAGVFWHAGHGAA
jgi:NitT/TauT family transport system substrate-binding protein